ncbi:MAG: hypothetical protein ACK4OM_07765 [Alphaproteobacteria bacterium]
MVQNLDDVVDQLFTILTELNLNMDMKAYSNLTDKEKKDFQKAEIKLNEVVLKNLIKLEKNHSKFFKDSEKRPTNQTREEDRQSTMVNALQYAVLQPNTHPNVVAQLIKMGTSEDCMMIEELGHRTALHLSFVFNNQVLIPTIVDSLKEKLKNEGKSLAEIKSTVKEFVNIEMSSKHLKTRYNNATALSLLCAQQRGYDNRSSKVEDLFGATEVEHLLMNGASPNFKDNKGNTPLHQSVIKGRLVAQHTNEEIKKENLKKEPLKKQPLKDESLYAYEATKPLLRILIKAGADIEEKNNEGKTFYAELKPEHQEEVKKIDRMVKLTRDSGVSIANSNDLTYVSKHNSSKTKSKGCSIM